VPLKLRLQTTRDAQHQVWRAPLLEDWQVAKLVLLLEEQ
jgi:hypothetical protein